MTKQKTLISFFTATAIAALSACGGGEGGTTTSAPTATPAPASASAPADAGTNSIVASVDTPTYSVGSEELAAFNLANNERAACGFGRLAQSTQLDLAAVDHADWMLTNNQYTHAQDTVAFPNGFTGDTPTARGDFRKFQGTVTEVITRFETDSISTAGVAAVRQFLSAPYHALNLLNGHNSVGWVVRNSTMAGAAVTSTQRIVASLGVGSTPQEPAVEEVLTYPCAGSTGLYRMNTGENPNPIPGRDLTANPIGHPVYVQGRSSVTVRIALANMTEVGSNSPIVMRAPVDSSNDPNGKIAKNVAYVAPDAALKANTTYRVQLTGTRDGVSFTKDFSFTTGNLI